MPFFLVDDQFHKHPKAERLLDAGVLGCQALALWAMAGSMSQAQLSTGLVRHTSAARLMGWSPSKTRRVAGLLVEVGLWEEASADGVPAWVYHDWLAVHRRTGPAVKNERERRAETKRPEIIEAVRARDGDWCRYCGKKVTWKANRSNAGGSYDHVDPHLIAGALNIVVCCLGCNRSKAGRTPEQWRRDDPENGHLLRPPPQPMSGVTLSVNGRAGDRTARETPGHGPADQIGNRSVSDREHAEHRSVSDPEQIENTPSTDRAQTESSVRVRVGARAGGPGQGTGQVRTGFGVGSGEGPAPATAPAPAVVAGRAGEPPASAVVPEHLLGGIGSPWANHHGPPPDVDSPTCPAHGLDLPCRRCHLDVSGARGP